MSVTLVVDKLQYKIGTFIPRGEQIPFATELVCLLDNTKRLGVFNLYPLAGTKSNYNYLQVYDGQRTDLPSGFYDCNGARYKLVAVGQKVCWDARFSDFVIINGTIHSTYYGYVPDRPVIWLKRENQMEGVKKYLVMNADNMVWKMFTNKDVAINEATKWAEESSFPELVFWAEVKQRGKERNTVLVDVS